MNLTKVNLGLSLLTAQKVNRWVICVFWACTILLATFLVTKEQRPASWELISYLVGVSFVYHCLSILWKIPCYSQANLMCRWKLKDGFLVRIMINSHHPIYKEVKKINPKYKNEKAFGPTGPWESAEMITIVGKIDIMNRLEVYGFLIENNEYVPTEEVTQVNIEELHLAFEKAIEKRTSIPQIA